jgi:hypothetical protein
MTAIELKNLLTHRISESNFLPLTSEQRDEILASKEEIAQGIYVENAALEKEIGGWLNTK